MLRGRCCLKGTPLCVPSAVGQVLPKEDTVMCPECCRAGNLCACCYRCYLQGRPSEGTSWPENTGNVNTSHLVAVHGCSVNTYAAEALSSFVLFFLTHSSPMKNRKRLARDIMFMAATHTRCIHDNIHTHTHTHVLPMKCYTSETSTKKPHQTMNALN